MMPVFVMVLHYLPGYILDYNSLGDRTPHASG